MAPKKPRATGKKPVRKTIKKTPEKPTKKISSKQRPGRKDKQKGEELIELVQKSVQNIHNAPKPSPHATAKSVQELINAGADLNVRGKRRSTALMYACRHRNQELALMLIDAGANVNAKDGANGWTALFEACMSMGGVTDILEDVVRGLINAGADVNVMGNGGDTLLMLACYYGKTEISTLWMKCMEARHFTGPAPVDTLRLRRCLSMQGRSLPSRIAAATLRKMTSQRYPQNYQRRQAKL